MKNKLFSFFSASFFSFYNLMLFSLMNVLGIYLIRDFSFTSAEIAFIASCDLWGNVFGLIPIGLLLDYFPIRRIGLFLLGMTFFSTVCMTFIHNFWLFCFLRFIQGIGSAGSLLITMRIGTTLFFRRANTTIGFMIFIALAGGIAGNSGFSYLAKHFGWHNGLIMIASLGLVFFLTMAFSFKDEKLFIPHISIKHSFNKYQFLAGFELSLLNTPVFILGSLFGNQYLISKASIPLETAASLSSLLFLGIMIGSPIIGYLADKVGNFFLLMFAFLLLISCTLILSSNYLSMSYFSYSIIFFLMGVACSAQNLIYPILYRYQLHFPSTSMAFAGIVFNAIGAFIQIGFGFLSHLSNLNQNLAFNALTFILLLGMILLFFFKSS